MIEGAPGRFVGDRYHIVRELGRGGMGVVYLGRDLRLDMDVAIKFRGVTHSDATLWLKREFRAVASLRHPNLVELYELVAHDRSCYYTMEYLPGLDPRRWVERTAAGTAPMPVLPSERTTRSAIAPLDLGLDGLAQTETSGFTEVASPFGRQVPSVDFGRVRTVLTQLAEGLAFLHACGVIHRDVKPSNAICVDGAVKLLDFGLALERDRQAGDLAREARIVGTAAYLAPEYVERLQVSPAMDVYALGVLGYELCTGAPPFGGALHLVTRLHKRIDVPRASQINPAVPPDLDALLARMLAADPAERPTALDVAAELSGELSQPRTTARRARRFIGRASELARIAGAVADPAPRARLVLIAGPSGAGKTALMDELVNRVRAASELHPGVIWRGRCHERERVPYRAFDLIIDDLATELAGDPRIAREVDHVAALCRVFPVLAPLIDPALGDEPTAADLRVERERALLAMTQLFRHLLRAPRGVIVIDDLQWADEDSLELLALLVERIDRPLTVLASWTIAEAGVPAGQQALLDRLGARVDLLDLPAMTEAELELVIADCAPQVPASRLASAARQAAGSPYLAELLGHELADAEVAGPLDAAEARRLARLAPEERTTVEIASLVGGAATFDQLRAIGGLASGRLQSVLRGLEDARVLRAAPSPHGDPVYVFYHQRLRDAAYAAMPAGVRRARHDKLAGWYEADGGDPGELAFHWQHAGEPERAASAAIAAAGAARSQLAWAIAADWYGRALELGAPDPLAARAGRAEALFLGGKLSEAADELELLARSDPRNRDRWRVRAAEAYLKLGEIDRGLRVIDGVLEQHGEARATSRAASMARAASVATRWLLAGKVNATAPSSDRDRVLAAAYRVIASFLSTPYPIAALEYVMRGIELAERSGDRAAHSQGLSMLAAYVGAASLGRFGDRVLARGQALASQAGAGAAYPGMVSAGSAGILAMLRGDWTGMRRAHEDGARICRRLGLERSWEASFLRSYWALGEHYAGEPARALVMLGELTQDADDLFSRAMLGSYRGRALVVAGDLSAARTLGAELARSPAARHGLAAVYRQVFAAELALAEHDWARAAALAGELARTVRDQWLSAMPAVSVMVDVVEATAALGLAAAGERAAAGRAVAVANRIYRRGRASFYAATALRLRGQGERLRGDQRAAEATLARAAAVAEERGGKLDRLAIAALRGERIEAAALAPAVAWSTGGIVRVQ